MDVLNCYSIKLNPLSLEPLPSLIDGFFNVNTFVMEKEIWKSVVGYEGKYQVSNKGRVRSLNYHREKRIKIMKSRIMDSGYEDIRLCENGKNKAHLMHRLVAKAFIPNPDNKRCVNHIDGDKSNNLLDNLEWVSYQENTDHALENDLYNFNGENHYNSILTKEDVLSIRKEYKPYVVTARMLSEKHGVSVVTIKKIVQRKKWKHI